MTATDPRHAVLMLGLLGDDPATTRYYRGVARTLDTSRYRLVFGTLRPAGQVQEAVRRHGHETFSLDCVSTLGYPRAVRSLVQIIRRERIDIVHGNEELASFIATLAGRLAGRGRRIYHRQHDTSASFAQSRDPHAGLGANARAWLASKRFGLADRWAGALADSVWTLSETHRRIVLQERPQWARKTVVVLHGVDPPADLGPARRRAAELRREIGIGEAPSLTIVARLNWRKGHRVLFDALVRLRSQEDLSPWLLVVGYGPLEAELRTYAQQQGLARVVFAGKHEDVWPYYLATDATLVPSVTEPFGLVAIEALACGRPVIASQVGGLQEIVEPGSSGRLVPPNDVPALADAIRQVLRTPEREAMGASARRRFEQLFSQEAMIGRWQKQYEALLA
jgi:glycosyltransferase involved in cell wall biosynthesis